MEHLDDIFGFIIIIALLAAPYFLVANFERLSTFFGEQWQKSFGVSQTSFSRTASVAIIFWIALLVLIFAKLVHLLLAPYGDSAQDFRLHYLAVVGVATFFIAIISAPLALVRLSALLRQTKTQEENLLTDRINKAVEGLGTEKTVSRTSRVISYRKNGEGFSFEHFYDDPSKLDIPANSTSVSYGDWETLTYTVPNLEVRIGSIYALERIARDNLDVHVQIMEILCAYVRENAPVKDAPRVPPRPDANNYQDYHEWQSAVFQWCQQMQNFPSVPPKVDITTVLSVLGRRTQEQKTVEWQNHEDMEVFLNTLDEVRAWQSRGKSSKYNIADAETLKKLRELLSIQRPRYRLDLRNTNLAYAKLNMLEEPFDFSHAMFDGSNLMLADLSYSSLVGASFKFAEALDANFGGVKAQGACLVGTTAHGAKFIKAELDLINCADAKLQSALFLSSTALFANFTSSQIQGASFLETVISSADLNNAAAQGASFDQAFAYRASFAGTHFDMYTSWDDACLDGSVFWARLNNTSISQRQLKTVFAEKMTASSLPESAVKPAHWPDVSLYPTPEEDGDGQSLNAEWQKWQREGGAYIPPKRRSG